MSVIVSRTHSEIYMRAPERRAAEEEILVFTAKLNWNTHFEMIVYYIARDGGQLGCPFLSVFRTLMPALLCPHSSLPPLRMKPRNQRTESVLLVSRGRTSSSKGKKIEPSGHAPQVPGVLGYLIRQF